MTNDTGVSPGISQPLEPVLDELRLQLAQLQQTLAAVSAGGADAVVLGDADDQTLYTIGSSDQSYRVIVENMGEGAATISERGMILYANPRLADFLGVERSSMIGRDLADYVGEEQKSAMAPLFAATGDGRARAELVISRGDGHQVVFLVTSTEIDLSGVVVRCLVFTDLTMQKMVEKQLAADAALAERQRVAHEVNDTIVQGLVAAEMALDLGQTDKARSLVASTSRHARAWIGDLAGGQQLEPGMAVRSNPVEHGADVP